VDKPIPEQAKQLGITEQEIIKNVMLKETANGEFTTVEDVAEVALCFAAFESKHCYLLILEIKVPKADDIVSVSLFAKLLDLRPSFLAFVTSFGTILVMWINHHRVFQLVRAPIIRFSTPQSSLDRLL